MSVNKIVIRDDVLRLKKIARKDFRKTLQEELNLLGRHDVNITVDTKGDCLFFIMKEDNAALVPRNVLDSIECTDENGSDIANCVIRAAEKLWAALDN
ncbi:hypothetical protein [Neisseria sp.]